MQIEQGEQQERIPPGPPFLLSEAAHRLHCSPRKVLELIQAGHLKAVWLGETARTIRIERDELRRFLDAGGVGRGS